MSKPLTERNQTEHAGLLEISLVCSVLALGSWHLTSQNSTQASIMLKTLKVHPLNFLFFSLVTVDSNTALQELIKELLQTLNTSHTLMKKEVVSLKDIEISFSLDICYIGQGYHLEIIIDLESENPLENVYRDFLNLHDRIYGHSVEGDVRIVNLRAIHRTPVFEEKGQAQLSSDRSVKETRQVLCDADSGFIETNVYDRSNLTRGQEIMGPAVVDQIDTTTWIPEGWVASVLEDSMLLLERIGKE